MQSTNLPSKYLVPFAKNDGAKVELPVTTATAGRASQSLGFPPITGQPPEAGGLPPQLEDFNGAMNQPARIAWWSQLGGKFPFDNTFATDANIGGYPLGAELVSSDNTGTWLSLADNNVANPDTVGTGWAPARAYGAFALTGQTGGTVTPTPVQAMKRRITIAGALTSNLIVILPNWLYSWDITNGTSGAFTVTIKTAAGAGVVIPQNGAPTPVVGDGTNIAQPAGNIAPATTSTQAMQLGQAIGRWLRRTVYTRSGATQMVSVDGGTATATGAGTFTALAATTKTLVRVQGGGAAGGGVVLQNASSYGVGGGGSAGAYAESILTTGFTGGVTITVGLGGSGGNGVAGGNGNTSSFGALVTAGGGNGGAPASVASTPTVTAGGNGATGTGNIFQGQGGPGLPGIAINNADFVSGAGGSSLFGFGANPIVSTLANGNPAQAFGAGGGGGGCPSNVGPVAGGAGGAGVVIVDEYA